MANQIITGGDGKNNTFAFSDVFVPSDLGATSRSYEYTLDFEIKTIKWTAYTRFGYAGDYFAIDVATESGSWVNIINQRGIDNTPWNGSKNDLKGNGYKKIRFRTGCQVSNNQYVTTLSVAVNQDLNGWANS